MKRDMFAVASRDSDVVTRLDAMLAELRALRRLYLAGVGADAEDAKLAELLHAIREWTRGDYAFSVRELLEYASLSAATAVRTASVANIRELDATAGKRLGQLLRKNTGRNINGLQIRREGSDSAGAIWTITSPNSFG